MNGDISPYLFEDTDALKMLEQRNKQQGYKRPLYEDPASGHYGHSIVPITETMMGYITDGRLTYDQLLERDTIERIVPTHVIANWISYGSMPLFKAIGCPAIDYLWNATASRGRVTDKPTEPTPYIEEITDSYRTVISPKTYRWHDRIKLYKATNYVTFLYIMSPAGELPDSLPLGKRIADEISEHEGFPTVIGINHGKLLKIVLLADVIDHTDLI